MSLRRQILVLGTLPWFADSFRIFQEAGFRCAFIRTQAPAHPWWAPVFPLLQDIGFTEAQESDAESFIRNGECTLIISGGELLPPGSYLPSGDSVAKLELFSRISSLSRKNRLPALAIRFFNGETYFISHEFSRVVEDAVQHADGLLYDNAALRAYVEYNCPRLAAMPAFNAITEAPLARFFHSAVGNPINPRILLTGRLPPTAAVFPLSPESSTLRRRFVGLLRRMCGKSSPRLPRSVSAAPQPLISRNTINAFDEFHFPYPLISCKLRAGLADSVAQLDAEREAMRLECASNVAGLSHFYDFPWHARIRPAFHPFGLEAQQTAVANPIGYGWTQIMRRINIASKAITYLMLGLPPIVPDDDEQPLTQMLKANNMCFAVGSQDLRWTSDLVSEKAINEKRQQVASHATDFAFERVVECINKLATTKFGIHSLVPLAG